MTSDLTIREDGLSADAVEARKNYAIALAASSLLPKQYGGNAANVLLVIEHGLALGLRPTAAINGINIINGKPTLSSDAMAAVVRRAGHKLRIIEDTDAMSVTAILIRADDPDFEFKVTWDKRKAQQAGLWGNKGPWTLYPMQMLRARAISEVCRQGASDALAGVIYTPEELGGTVDGEVITEQPASPASGPSPAASASAPSPARPANAASPAPAPQGDDERLAALQAECAALVTSWCDRFGGDPEEIAAEWQAIDGTANPRDLKKWLFAKAQAMKGQKK